MLTETYLTNSIVRVFNFNRFIFENHIGLNPRLIVKKRGVDCFKQVFLIKIELLSYKKFRESI